MMSRRPRGPRHPPLELSERQQAILEQFIRQSSRAQALVLRARIILEAASGTRLTHIAETWQIHRDTVRRWCQRWAAARPRLEVIEATGEDKALGTALEALLSDAPRSGHPGKFTAEQICQILAVACEPVEASGRPVSHWTPREVAEEVVQRGLVPSISPRQVGRFLKGGRFTAPSGRVLAESRACR